LLDRGSVRIADLIIVICWVLFWAYWLIAAWSSKAGRSPSARFVGARVAIIVVVVYLVRALGFRSHLVQNDPVLTGVGMALFFLGLALAIWARIYIGRNWVVPTR
jgi:hypothetical protein